MDTNDRSYLWCTTCEKEGSEITCPDCNKPMLIVPSKIIARGDGIWKNIDKSPTNTSKEGPTQKDFSDMVNEILENTKQNRVLHAWMCEDGEWKPIEQTRMFDEAMKRAAENYLKDNKEEDGQIQ